MDGSENIHPALVEALMRPEAYPEPVQGVQMRETHASCLFFTGDRVYKVKKPVDYGFLDFTTLEKRRFYCLQEIALNSRMSPEVYLGVVPIRQQGRHFKIRGKGTTIEYAVKMKQLCQSRALDELLRHDQVSQDDIRRVAGKIACFHQKAATSPDITRLGDLATVRHNIEENFEQTQEFISRCLSQIEFDDLEAYSLAFMKTKAALFERRAEQGRVRDGHGDLHAANVFLENGIHIIDCIEFNDRFRCLDVAEDIAFLAMDLDFYQRHDLSELFVSAYVEQTQDQGLPDLLDFFKVYRALVRGKVTGFQLDRSNLPADEAVQMQKTAQAYFRLAHSYVKKIRASPLLVLVAGLIGTGKTRVSQELAKRWNMVHLSSDVTRKKLAGVELEQHQFEAYNQGIYSPEWTRRTYEALGLEARQRLASGEAVVVDANFRRSSQRQQMMEMASGQGADLIIIECITSEDEIKRRLEQRVKGARPEVSDGRWELFEQHQADWEPIQDVAAARHIRLDTGGPRPDTLKNLIQMLFERWLT